MGRRRKTIDGSPDEQRAAITAAMAKHGTIKKTAKALDMSAKTLVKVMHDLGIETAKPPRKTLLNAQALGISEEEYIRGIVEKHGGISRAAKAEGLQLGQLQHGIASRRIRIGDGRRQRGTPALEEYNAINGTSHVTLQDLVESLPKNTEINTFAKTWGFPVTSIHTAYRAVEQPTKATNNNQFRDVRPTDIPGPWTDPDRSPCGSCGFSWRSKNEPGCVKCPRAEEYHQLVAQTGGYVGIPTTGRGTFRE